LRWGSRGIYRSCLQIRAAITKWLDKHGDVV
jgi:hypothetical protein